MINDKNPRKVVSTEMKALAAASFATVADERNPYAFVVTVETPTGPRSFRVIVKELA